MIDMTAKKSLVYASRRLNPGEHFVAKSARDAKLLTAIGKAARKVTESDEAPKADIPALRETYRVLSGKRAFHGWDAETLAGKIAELEA